MAVRVVLIDADGRPQSLADPSGGTFNAAGDFDSLIGLIGVGAELPMWSSLYTEEDWTFVRDDLVALLRDLDALDGRAQSEAERRGLLRLRLLAETALIDPELTLEWQAD